MRVPASKVPSDNGEHYSNDELVIWYFNELGITAAPRVDVLTYEDWAAKGRQVGLGEAGLPIVVIIADKEKQKNIAWHNYLFHVEQTKPIEEGKPADDQATPRITEAMRAHLMPKVETHAEFQKRKLKLSVKMRKQALSFLKSIEKKYSFVPNFKLSDDVPRYLELLNIAQLNHRRMRAAYWLLMYGTFKSLDLLGVVEETQDKHMAAEKPWPSLEAARIAAESYLRKPPQTPKFIADHVAAMMGRALAVDSRVLAAGLGNSHFLRAAAQNTAWRIHGVEENLESVLAARINCASHVNITVFADAFMTFNKDLIMYDAAFVHVHAKDSLRTLQTVFGATQEGGLIFVVIDEYALADTSIGGRDWLLELGADVLRFSDEPLQAVLVIEKRGQFAAPLDAVLQAAK